MVNAIKHNRPEGEVLVEAEPAGEERIRLSVSDTGMGIPEDALGRLFVPFERLDAALSDDEGTGLELARERSPHLILLDLHLPDLGGEQVLARLQADASTREIPVVVLSADATGRQRAPLLAAGALEYLTEPIEVRALLEVIDRVLAPAPMAARSDGG